MDVIEQMQSFVRIVEAGSLSGAARAQKLSLPAISRQLSALERELGGKLLLRTTRRLQVTDAGRAFYEQARGVLAGVERARAVVSDARGVRGTLTVSAAITLGMSEIVPHLPKLTARHPQLSIELRLEDRVADLVGEGVDVAIRGGVPLPNSADLVAQRLRSFHRVAVAAPAYVERRGRPKTPAQLARHDCLRQLSRAGQPSRWTFLRDAEEQVVEVRGALSASAPLALRELALAGAGVAFLGAPLVARDLRARRLFRLLDGWQSAEVSIWALYRTELRGSAKLRAFLDAVAD
jgi:DNA-binding transcriptional LysR family regulator